MQPSQALIARIRDHQGAHVDDGRVVMANGPRALTVDRFGVLSIGGRVAPAVLKASGEAFAWQLRSDGAYRTWIPREGWSGRRTHDEAMAAVYWYTHGC